MSNIEVLIYLRETRKEVECRLLWVFKDAINGRVKRIMGWHDKAVSLKSIEELYIKGLLYEEDVLRICDQVKKAVEK